MDLLKGGLHLVTIRNSPYTLVTRDERWKPEKCFFFLRRVTERFVNCWEKRYSIGCATYRQQTPHREARHQVLWSLYRISHANGNIHVYDYFHFNYLLAVITSRDFRREPSRYSSNKYSYCLGKLFMSSIIEFHVYYDFFSFLVFSFLVFFFL